MGSRYQGWYVPRVRKSAFLWVILWFKLFEASALDFKI